MSTIRVDNFGPSAGGTTYSARGIAKAWVNFNGTWHHRGAGQRECVAA
jgi:hypothetical protein